MDDATAKPSRVPFGLNAIVAMLALSISVLPLLTSQRLSFENLVNHLGPLLGVLSMIVVAIVAIGSLLTVPLTLLLGLAAMITSFKHGALTFLYGVVAVGASLTSLFVWVKYHGLPIHLHLCHGCVFGVG
jgi:hypothetical protein